ncbi:MAG: hypothetical protein EOM83_16410 [Clostridia bacterium]|nr:hypothetical protein [Clostridia bacterium]
MTKSLLTIILLLIVMGGFAQPDQEENPQQQVDAPFQPETNRNPAIIEVGYESGIAGGYDRYKFSFFYGLGEIDHFYFGLGVGARFYIDSQTFVMPVLANARVFFIDTGTTPFLSLDAGYSFNMSSNDPKLGALLSPKLGVRFRPRQGSGIELSVGYEYQAGGVSDELEAVSFNIGFLL